MSKKLHKRASASLPMLLWLMLLTLLPAQLSARDFEYTYEGQTLTYTVLDEDAKTVRTSQGRADVGNDGNAGNYASGDLVIPATVLDESNNEYTVTTIGSYAFFRQGKLTSVVIPNSVTEIGEAAFRECSGLTSVVISNSVAEIGYRVFEKCTGLLSVDIPNSVTSIGERAFFTCSDLTSVVIPNSVTSIGERAFWCSGLTSVVIPNSVTSIGESAFYSCSGLTSVDIPNSVTEIGSGAFSSCTGLTSVNIPNSVTEISCFPGCSGLTSIDIPNSVTSIGSSAFSGCSGLTSIDIPSSVTSIGEYAFSRCSGLTSFVIPSSVTSIGEYAFNGCIGLTSFVIPSSVTTIGERAFDGCSGLKKSAYPSTLSNPFSYGAAVRYPASGTYYENDYIWSEDNTVLYFVPLTVEGEYTLPESVTEIGKDAFTGCGLTTLNVNSTIVPMMDSEAFKGLYDKCPLNVPDNMFVDYMTTSNWHLFENINGDSMLDNGNFIYRTNPVDATAVLVGPAKSMTEATILAKVSLDNKMYTVKAIGADAFKSKGLTKVTFRDGIEIIGDNAFYINELRELVLPESVKTIGDYAFAHNYLASVTIGSGVETIGNRAFYQDFLTEVVIPGSVKTIGDYAFAMNSKLASATIGSGVETIGAFAFYYDALTEVVIPASVRTIGSGAFYENTKLASVTIGSGVETIGSSAFYYDALAEVVIPASVRTIGSRAFQHNTRLASVTIGSGVETIGNYAFCEDALAEVVIPDSVKTIGNYAFAENTNLASATIGSGVETIGNNAFQNDALTEVVIPAGVKNVGNSAFVGNKNLTTVIFNESVDKVTLDTKPFDALTNLTMGRNYEGQLPTVTNIELGNQFTEITEGFMSGSTSLKSVKFGTGISEIPAKAFKGCSLSEVVIPSNITTIGESAFENNKLTNVIIGCGTAEIGHNAFAYNNSIATINVTAVEPPVASDDVFTTQNAQLNVLKASREAYENALCWYQFEGTDLVPVSVFKILGESVPAEAPSRAAVESAVKQLQMSVSIEPANASLKEYITWSSSNPEIATVDNNGLVTIYNKIKGEAKITAHTLYDGVVASVTVNSDGNSGIDDIYFDTNNGTDGVKRPNDIYNLQGICLKRNASQDDIDALAPGFYIIAGKKVVVR